MQSQQGTMFLQSLRGNQALVVLAYLVVRRAMTLDELEDMTGLHNDTVRTAVRGLASKGFLFKQTGEHGRQTWLPVAETFFAQLMGQNPRTSDSAFVVVNVESEESEKNKLTTLTDKRQNPRTSDSGARVLSSKVLIKTDDEIRVTLDLLRSHGIVGGKAEDIAEDHHITDEQIEQVIRWTKGEDWDSPLGMAIYRLQNHLLAPELNENDHEVDCRCGQCGLLRRRERSSLKDWYPHFEGGDHDEESEEQ
jgi:DNA-binding transcriptional regulator GbsR (MarR family)